VHLFLWVARARVGDRAGADAALAEAFKDRSRLPLGVWYGLLADFLLGRRDGSALFSPGEEAGGSFAERHCEANFYAGAKALVEGDARRAEEFWSRCAATSGRRDLPEFLAAAADLRAPRRPR
jgi:lipoprotein NlpI